MGNCSRKGGRDVAEKGTDRADGASSTPPPPERPPTPHGQDATEAAEGKKKKRKRRSKVAAATSEASTPAPSPSPPPPRHDLPEGTSGNPQVKPSDGQKPPLHHVAAPNKNVELEKSNPSALSKAHESLRDSAAVRLEQGSSYVWLRNTYTNPHLKPAPLLTVGQLRELRNKNTDFHHLWDALGEAACAMGPYAAAPLAGPSPSLLEGNEMEDEGVHLEPSIVNDEVDVVTPENKGRTAAGEAAGARFHHHAGHRGGGGGDVEGAEMKEIRVLNQFNISIEGDEAQRLPIVCRGDVYRGKHLWISKLRSRCCFVFEYLGGVDLKDCSDALVVLAPTAGALSLSNCHRCLIIAAAAQLRVLSCSSIILSVNVAGFPVIEKSTSIGVAPLLGWYAFSNLPIHFRSANLSLFTNNYSTVRDVTPPTAANAVTSSLSCADGTLKGAAAPVGSTAPLRPASNFVYVDLLALEAAVWKAMAEQRWHQLVAEVGTTAATAPPSPQVSAGRTEGHALHRSPSAPLVKVLTPAQSPLVSSGNNATLLFQKDDYGNEEPGDEGGDSTRATTMVTDGAFHSMISYGHLSQLSCSRTHLKGSSITATTASAGEMDRSSHAVAAVHAVPSRISAPSLADSLVPQLPRWRRPSSNDNMAASESPLEANSHKASSDGKSTAMQAAEQKQRSAMHEAEHLVRAVLRTVPLLLLSALREAPELLLSSDTDGTATSEDDGAEGRKPQGAGPAGARESREAARYNHLESALAIYTHTCAVPATFGAQLIPADIFEQAWKLKLIVLTAKGGGYELARRIVRDIELSRRRCALEVVRAMPYAPPLSTRSGGGARGMREMGRGDSHGNAAPSWAEESTFYEALWCYLRTTSLAQRCGPVLLLNTAELQCTETTVREFVAPVFYKLCEPIGLKSATEVKANAAHATSGGVGRRLHLPWASGSSSNAHGSAPPSVQQLEHNVEMRRLFGTAIQRMTGQTCLVMLALLAPKKIPPSFQRPAGVGGRHSNGAMTPAELDSWTKRAEEARLIFTPQKNAPEGPHVYDERGGIPAGSQSEPTAPESAGQGNESLDGDATKGKKSGPAFTPPLEGGTAPRTLEERVWPQTVLLNVTVPLRFVSLLQGTLFFKSQMRTAATAGVHPTCEREPEQKH
ncbi:hypothetical protein ABL78_6552 [Leptomonas seymouri]|uniref:C-CAP/cofactor C-like domain-containing protein n=1 Tax=Leptomonas seymouri TaxID=5684 RepID=A0A0N1PAA4_LEPSE|nr:hypothetical protein ABL78_6552 [Leptomonas seymouri]|eukprot:KPI84391.1 hypothetical protein ABL78_6552 [Leptomonas seymouri]